MLCGSVDERRAGKYMAEVRTSSQSERPCAGIEETRKPPGDAGGSSSPVNGDDHTGKRLAGKPHEPFERADGGRATARPPPTLHSEDGKAVHMGKGGRCPETRAGRYARCETPKPSWGSSACGGHWRAGCSERRTPGSGRGGWKSAHGVTRQPPTPPRPLLRGVEQAHRSALAHHVHRTARLGASVLINGTWY